MTRKKVKLTYITNDSARKATFKKRKKGLMKKVHELSTLCGIQACAIVYSPYDPQSEVWPSPMGVHRVLDEFKNMPEMDQTKKMMDQESFIQQRINKATEQLRKFKRDTREKEVQQVLFHSLPSGKAPESMTVIDFYDIQWVIDHHLRDINKKLGEDPDDHSPVVDGLAFVTMMVPQEGDVAVPQEIAVENIPKQQWLMEMMSHQENNKGLDGNGMNSMMMPFGDQNINDNAINDNNTMSIWTSSYYP